MATLSGSDEAELLGRMREEIERVIVTAEDKVNIFPLCGLCEGKIVKMGEGEIPEDRPYYIV